MIDTTFVCKLPCLPVRQIEGSAALYVWVRKMRLVLIVSFFWVRVHHTNLVVKNVGVQKVITRRKNLEGLPPEGI